MFNFKIFKTVDEIKILSEKNIKIHSNAIKMREIIPFKHELFKKELV